MLKAWIFLIISALTGATDLFIRNDLTVKSILLLQIYRVVLFVTVTSVVLHSYIDESYLKINEQGFQYVHLLSLWTCCILLFFVTTLFSGYFRKFAQNLLKTLASRQDALPIDSVLTVKVAITIAYALGLHLYGTVFAGTRWWVFVLIANVTVSQFVLTMSMDIVFNFLKRINHQLASVLDSEKSKQVFVIDTDFKMVSLFSKRKFPIDIIRQTSSEYRRAEILFAQLKQCSSIQIAIFCILRFLQLSFLLYKIIVRLTFCQEDGCYMHDLDRYIYLGNLLILTAIQLVGLSVSCQFVYDEAKTTGKIIHNIINSSLSRDVKEKLEIFSLRVLSSNFQVTGLGFFAVDNTLLYSMVQGITSTLILLIQFQRMISSERMPDVVQNEL